MFQSHHGNQNGENGSNRPVLATLTLISSNSNSTTSALTSSTSSSTQLPRHVNITSLPYRIGRDPKFSDLTLDTPSSSRMISRRHCIIQYNYSTKRFLCIDQKSLNGTFVNGERIGSKEIDDGDCLVFTGGSSYAIGDSITVPASLDASHMDISMNNTSGVIEPTTTTSAPTSSSSSSASSSHTNSSSNKISRQAMEEYLCQMPNTFVYKFNIVQHPNDYTPAPTTLSFSPSLIPKEEANGNNKTTTDYNILSQTGTDTSKKRERTSNEAEEEAEVHSAKKARFNTSEPGSVEQQHQTSSPSSPISPEQEIAALKNQLTTLQQELQKAREANIHIQNTSSHANTVLLSILESEFHCSICQSLLLHPTTLQCSHTFCTTCIQQWLPKHPNCPICRKKITKQPIRNISLQGVLEKLEMLLSQEDKDERREREAEILKKEEDDLQKLNALIQNAKNRGMKFLKIEDEWSEHDRKVFMAGLAKYSGTKAKQVYLNLTGLNLESIAKLTGNSLQRVCNNVGITPVLKNKNTMPEVLRSRLTQQQLIDTESTRERLREFWRNEIMSAFSGDV